MSKLRKKYTKSEKLEIVSLSLEEDQKIKDLSVRFGVSENTIYNWRSTYAKHKESSFPGKGNKTMSESERKSRIRESYYYTSKVIFKFGFELEPSKTSQTSGGQGFFFLLPEFGTRNFYLC